jgi:two-component system, OmpR family, response regulator VanR
MSQKTPIQILKDLNILYIEDEKNIRENVKKTLLLFSNNVFDAENLENASKIFEENRIDIVISDINLNHENGIDYIKKIRQTDKTLPIILLSAYTDKNYLLEATRLKLVDYLTKPIDFKTLNNALLNCVEDILENSRYIISFKNGIDFNVLQKKLKQNKSDEEILLTQKELNLLELLLKNRFRVTSIDEIKSFVWQDEDEASDSALKNLLNKLRSKLGKDGIENISGIGYRINI